MKNIALNFCLLTFLLVGVSSCKNNEDKTHQTETKEAQEVKTASESDEVHTYAIDQKDSEIKWEGSKAIGTRHHGVILTKDGEFQTKEDQLIGGKILIDMNTIDVQDLEGKDKERLEAHLKGTAEGKEGDFFNVTEFPEAVFEITKVEQAKDDKAMISGNLTLKGETNNISFPAKVTFVKDNKVIKIVSDAFKIDRTKWDVNFGSKSVFDNLVSNNIIEDAITLNIMVKGNVK